MGDKLIETFNSSYAIKVKEDQAGKFGEPCLTRNIKLLSGNWRHTSDIGCWNQAKPSCGHNCRSTL